MPDTCRKYRFPFPAENGKPRLFFCGIGGIGMSAVARGFADLGFPVSGYDKTPSAVTAGLAAEGIHVSYSSDACRLLPGDVFVPSLAISDGDPLMKTAKRLGLATVSRTEALSYLLGLCETSVAVSGTHGKSTTTAMLAGALSPFSPTVYAGADLGKGHGSYLPGGQAVGVAEACEYRDAFLALAPSIAVVLNIEYDHADYFSSQKAVEASFRRFAAQAGKIVANGDDIAVREALSPVWGRVFTFGYGENCRLRAVNVRAERGYYAFDVLLDGKPLGRLALNVPGRHFIPDALAAVAVCTRMGMRFFDFSDAIASFSGVARRMEKIGTFHGAAVYSDYAHHPTEIRATFASLREQGYSRIVCVFQPHTYSRTQSLYRAFTEAFDADTLIFLPVFAARETNAVGLDENAFAADCRAVRAADFEDAARLVSASVTGDSAVLLLGAGDADRVFSYLS